MLGDQYQDVFERELRQQLSDCDRHEARLLTISGEVQEQITHIQAERAYVARKLEKLREIKRRYPLRGRVGSSFLDEVHEE